MSKPRLNPPKPPRRPGSSLPVLPLAVALLVGAAGGGYAAHVVTKNRAAQECREALQAQILSSLPTEPPPTPGVKAEAPVPADAASAAEPAASAAATPEPVASAAATASAPASKVADAPATKAQPKPAPSVKPVAPSPSKAPLPVAPRPPVLIPTTAVTAQPAGAQTNGSTSDAAPRPVPAPSAPSPAPAAASAPAKPVVDMTPRNPQVVARNGDVLFVRINEKTTLQVKKGAPLAGFGVLQSIEADGAHFDSGVIPLAK